jgi:hypothetical protein
MIKLSLTISDSSGVLQTIEKSFSSPNLLTSFDEIEDACESFISEAIPATEKCLLEKAQSHFTEQTAKKKR